MQRLVQIAYFDQILKHHHIYALWRRQSQNAFREIKLNYTYFIICWVCGVGALSVQSPHLPRTSHMSPLPLRNQSLPSCPSQGQSLQPDPSQSQHQLLSTSQSQRSLYLWLVVHGFFSLPSLLVPSSPSTQLSSLVTSSPVFSTGAAQLLGFALTAESILRLHHRVGLVTRIPWLYLGPHELHLHPLSHWCASTWRSSAPPAGLWLCLHHHGGLRLVCL